MFTLIFYGDNWQEAERLADVERAAKRKAGVRDARRFNGEIESGVDAVNVLPCVDNTPRAAIAVAYPGKVGDRQSYVTLDEANAYFAAMDVADTIIGVVGQVAPAVEYKAAHRGRGSYSVMVNGAEVVEGMTRLEAKAFDEYSPSEKLAFVANRAKG